ncbi:MAG: hypothetical protein EBU49_06665 [Proteobacteria bacterium]|nr:hypothetical protein [Pseudomonadota bacterium]
MIMKTRILKSLAIAVVALFAVAGSQAMASPPAEGSVVAQGGVFYKMPSGEMVLRDATLEVPARGEGNVILRSGLIEMTAHGFKTVHSHGRAIFNVVFLNPPGAPENTAVLYRGSYLRGSNAANFWGDVFIRTFSTSAALSALTKNPGVDALVSDFENSNDDGQEWKHGGGFWFNAKIGEAN